ncbi:MAG: alpha/beta hydrolase [Rubrivivax sp.]
MPSSATAPSHAPDATAALERNALDAQFRLDRITDLDGLMRRRAQAAQHALTHTPCLRALRYAPGDGHTLNLFLPEASAAAGTAGTPLLMFIHGGFWRSLDADLFSFVAPGFVAAGAAVAVIDYPLMPAARMADVVDACFAALSFLHRTAGDHRIDAQRIHVSGNSAGGHLVAELMDAAQLRRRGLPAGLPAGGCALSGLYDLEPVRQSFQNDFLGLTPQEVAEFSPLRRPYTPAAPVIATVGALEMEEFLRQNQVYAQRCEAAGQPVQHRQEPGMDHLSVVLDALADPRQALHRQVRAMMGLPDPA